ncbi:PaaX family transcriptional regulator [Acinetobacter haemolyticus]|uniref:PaaX family transcriptional regulator n=1 Tax=Acinetobacter haemolyticus TaxID=29430 RepID=UPI000D68C02D|nr:PaaX family transcriptional regulator [Acinetobacter haemolyticus]
MTTQKINARTLITDLLMAAEGKVISIKEMILAAKLFGLSENGVRVAVTRLASEGVIVTAERGVYQLSDQSHEWANVMLNRSTKGLKETKPWNQHYLCVFTGMLGRVDRTALKRRERALKHFGFRELELGVFVRPDNLVLSLEEILTQMKSIGLESEAKMCYVSSFDQITESKIKELWSTETLNKNYEKYSYIIQHWLTRLPALGLEDAARESLLLGRQTISLLMNDPLLPETFVNVEARNQFACDVKKLDEVGQLLWRQLHELTLGTSASNLSSLEFPTVSNLPTRILS